MPYGRTRRSAPTQTISKRKAQLSDAVTPVFVGRHGPCVRPRQSETSSRSFDNGRTGRASLQRATRLCVRRRTAIRVVMIRVTLCRGGPMCPPVLVRALYAIWADTQVRPYTNHIKTKSSAIRRCNTSICREARSVRPSPSKRNVVKIVRQRTHRSCVPTGFSHG